ncbi:MAG: 16S rRNA (cytosine(967)-C(5))-methyltransferase RsmB [Clostridia bacterium]|nr:16S rRNA (cytosine(967)-C(5))-methyltransferase RsmB [Clostridia bacterium]
MNKDFRLAFDILDKVYREGAYSNVLLTEVIDKADNRGLVTKIVYGTLEKNITLDYYVKILCQSKPNSKALTILKMGLYLQKFMDSVPAHAIVNEMVNLTNYIRKSELTGFVNATLKNAMDKDFPLPKDEKEALSVEYSVPLWLVKAYFKQYKRDTAIKILQAGSFDMEHIRCNSRKIDNNNLKSILKDLNISFSESDYGGYFVQNNKDIRDLFNKGLITYQSPSSMLVCKACDVQDNFNVLDMCSSPGGKAVYLSELANNLQITACDIYPNRVEKIKEYCERMGACNINAVVMDGTKLNKDLEGKFDLVLCDSPCSGLGVARKKPDIYLNKRYDDILALSEIQYKLLNNAIDYTKTNGHIIYSTCTILREENYNIVGRILKERQDICLEKMNIPMDNDGFIQLLQNGQGLDGFFIARLRKC